MHDANYLYSTSNGTEDNNIIANRENPQILAKFIARFAHVGLRRGQAEPLIEIIH